MPGSTLETEYAERLARLSGAPWKKLLDVQRPYRCNLQRLHLGRVLDVGCGVGRNLAALHQQSVGIDHNARCVEIARAHGLRAYTPRDFTESGDANLMSFDALLFAHVLEHMDAPSSERVVRDYLPFLKPKGRVVIVTPQEAGFKSDDTHVRFVDFDALRDLSNALGLQEERTYSFPFPRWAGRIFPYNEFVFIASLCPTPR